MTVVGIRCRHQAQQTTHAGKEERTAATLKLTRNRSIEKLGLVGRRLFEIVLDGTVVGTLPPREIVELLA
jgi:hypothetical protein